MCKLHVLKKAFNPESSSTLVLVRTSKKLKLKKKKRKRHLNLIFFKKSSHIDS